MNMKHATKQNVLLLCFFLSGFTGLVYEITWLKKSALSFGVTLHSMGVVLAVFFGGLALGNMTITKFEHKIGSPLKLYGFIEVGIAIHAFLSPYLFLGGDYLYHFCYPFLEGNIYLLTLCKVIITSILLLPSTISMGLGYPLFCSSMMKEFDKKITLGLLYGVNTTGAVVGCFLVGFYLIPTFGMNTSLWLSALLNLFVGGVCVVIYKNKKIFSVSKKDNVFKENSIEAGNVFYGIMFFFMGFTLLTYEILWGRFLTLIIQNTVYVYTISLGVTLVGIALGAFFHSVIETFIKNVLSFLAIILLVISIVIIQTLFLPIDMWVYFIDNEHIGVQILLCSLLMIIPSVLSGITYPLLMRAVIDENKNTMKNIGVFTGLNTFGAICGSLFGSFVLLPVMGMEITVYILTILTSIVAMVILYRNSSPRKYVYSSSMLFFWGVGVVLFSQTRIPHSFLGKERDIIAVYEGVNADIAVKSYDEKSKVLEINRLWQGSDRKTHQIVSAYVPLLIHNNAQSVAVVGLGTGQTAKRFLMGENIQKVHCIDIERELPIVIKEHFHGEWIDDSRVAFIHDDGRNYLINTTEKYDIVSIEIGQTFRPGCASFYTQEFYEGIKNSLKPGAVVSQFIPIVFLSQEYYASIIKTFISSFPHALLWYNRNEFLLLGSESPISLSSQSVNRFIERSDINKDLGFTYWGGSEYTLNQQEVFLSSFLAGSKTLQLIGEKYGSILHDDFPELEFFTARRQKYYGAYTLELLDFIKKYGDSFRELITWDITDSLHKSMESIREHNLNDIPAQDLYNSYKSTNSQDSYHLVKALQYNPKNVMILSELIQYCLKRKDYGKAELYLSQLKEVAPRFEGLFMTYGQLYNLKGEYHKAVSFYFKSINRKATAQKYNNLGTIYVKLNEYDKGMKFFYKALQLDQNYLPAQKNISLLKNSVNTKQ